jgi:hypothetical protein
MTSKSIVLGAAVLMLTAAVTLPAEAARTGRSQDGISAVDVSWSDAAHTKVRITWAEAAPVSNMLSLKSIGDDPAVQFGTTSAGDPNEFVVTATTFGNSIESADTAWVVVTDPAGDEARSAGFDRFIHWGDPVLTITSDNVLHWRLPTDTGADSTPNDPLDLSRVYKYSVVQRVDNDPVGTEECRDIELPVTTTPAGILPDLGHAYNLYITISNEWGTVWAPPGSVDLTTAVELTSPGITRYGAPSTFTGEIFGLYLTETGRPPTCNEGANNFTPGQVLLEAKTIGSSIWSVVATGNADNFGRFQFTVPNQGAREYRAVRPNAFDGHAASYGGISGTRQLQATTRLMSAKFINPVITYGAKPQAYLWVQPEGTQRAALQFKNASGAWQGIQYKTLSAGRGLLQFGWYRRGVTQFRWWVSGTAISNPIYTGAFSLTVR